MKKMNKKMKPEYVTWVQDTNIRLYACPHCVGIYIAGDSMRDYGYEFCPYCGKKLTESEEEA